MPFCFNHQAIQRLLPRNLLLILPPLLAGCASTIQHDYHDPKAEVRHRVAPNSRWVKPQNGEFVIQRDWWKAMGDPELDQLINAAISGNIDLKLLVKRVQKAEIELKGAKRDQWPTFSATAGYSASRSRTSAGLSGTQSNYSSGIGLHWEADLWGKLKHLKDAQWRKFQATEADWRAGYLGLISDLTNAYFTLRQLDEQHGLHRVALAAAKRTLEIYQRRVDGGVENKDRLNRQKAEVLRLERELLEISRLRQIKNNEISYLLGKPAGTQTLSESPLRKRVKFIELPEQITANLLERRPDIVAAELRVKEAYHLRESDRAARLPSISLGLSLDASAAAASALTQNWTAAILPKISFPSLDPATKTRLKISEVEAEEAVENYKKVVLNAIREVEDTLINLRNHRHQLDVETKRVKELEASQQKAKIRLQGGIITQLEVFETERRLLESQQKCLEIYRLVLQDTVQLHNALGGGWK